MNKCECYEEKEVIDSYLYDRRLIGICNGTKERDECCCGGNPVKCDFYPEIKEKARRIFVIVMEMQIGVKRE